jgi:hypothetical protein
VLPVTRKKTPEVKVMSLTHRLREHIAPCNKLHGDVCVRCLAAEEIEQLRVRIVQLELLADDLEPFARQAELDHPDSSFGQSATEARNEYRRLITELDEHQ